MYSTRVPMSFVLVLQNADNLGHNILQMSRAVVCCQTMRGEGPLIQNKDVSTIKPVKSQ